jgi:hypothetical protein
MFGEIIPKIRGVGSVFSINTINGTPFEITANTSYGITTLSFPSILHTANSTVLDDGSSNMTVGNNLTITGITTLSGNAAASLQAVPLQQLNSSINSQNYVSYTYFGGF